MAADVNILLQVGHKVVAGGVMLEMYRCIGIGGYMNIWYEYENHKFSSSFFVYVKI